jgi:hypothetical protein
VAAPGGDRTVPGLLERAVGLHILREEGRGEEQEDGRREHDDHRDAGAGGC